MKKSKFTDSQIMEALKRAESGIAVPEICRELGVSTATFYNWRGKYGGMDVSLMARMKELEAINVPGKINSLAHDGCLAVIGPVTASMTRATLQAMVNAVEEIEDGIGSALASVGPSVEPRNGWVALGFDRDRQCYLLNLRGVCWDASRSEVVSFVRDGAVPFLARGTTSKLLQGTNGLGGIDIG